MAKRELIDRKELYVPSDENDYDELVQFADDVMSAQVITEQEIVKPYLNELKDKIRSDMESIMGRYNANTPEYDRPSLKITRNQVRTNIITLIDNLLSEDGEE